MAAHLPRFKVLASARSFVSVADELFLLEKDYAFALLTSFPLMMSSTESLLALEGSILFYLSMWVINFEK